MKEKADILVEKFLQFALKLKKIIHMSEREYKDFLYTVWAVQDDNNNSSEIININKDPNMKLELVYTQKFDFNQFC